MLSHEDNDLVTRAGPGTPFGDLMRRYWIPALLSEEVPTPDCPPVRVQIMGEHLVVFRDTNGRVGLLDEHCSHRGTSLFYGRNEECGLRCIYHGWKYDVEGHVLDTPAEPAESTMKRRILHPAYPTHEAAGIVFAYMGPADKQPLFPDYVWASVPLDHTQVSKSLQECSYLQGLEGECDSSHLTFLHRSFAPDDTRRDLFALPISEYTVEETDFGIRLVAVRDAGEGQYYVRVSSFVMPVDCWIPGAGKAVHFYVPAGDDAHSWRYNLSFGNLPPAGGGDGRGEVWIDPDYGKIRNLSNHYLQDREAQKTVNYTGMGSVFPIHDSCATESMGPIYDRTREHLGVSDKAVVAVRRYLLDVIKRFQAGEQPPNVIFAAADNHVEHADTLAEIVVTSDWRSAFPHLQLSRKDLAGIM